LSRLIGLGDLLAFLGLVAQLAPHLPADPQQQHAAGEQQADDLQQLGGDQRKADAQRDGGDQAVEDGSSALLDRQGRGGQADRDRVVAGQDQVDHQNLEECGEGAQVAGEQVFEHAARLMRDSAAACNRL
jgi:hypothetical protein